MLRGALEVGAGRTVEDIRQAVIDATLTAHPADDIALLVAHTRLLAPSQLANWDVPQDPAAVATARAECGAQLPAWKVADFGFAIEPILSELITNAIRYGTPPIRVRLLHDSSVICEVSDGSSTSPRLRRAESTDEGGRGLFLVAQFAQRSGPGPRRTARSSGPNSPPQRHPHHHRRHPADALLDQCDDPAIRVAVAHPNEQALEVWADRAGCADQAAATAAEASAWSPWETPPRCSTVPGFS